MKITFTNQVNLSQSDLVQKLQQSFAEVKSVRYLSNLQPGDPGEKSLEIECKNSTKEALEKFLASLPKLEKTVAKQERKPIVVASKSYAQPPDFATNELYIVAAMTPELPENEWQGNSNQFAQIGADGQWHFADLAENEVVYVKDEGIHYRWVDGQFVEELYLPPKLRVALQKRGVAQILDGINDLAMDAAAYEADMTQNWQAKLDTVISTFEGTSQKIQQELQLLSQQSQAESRKVGEANNQLNQTIEQLSSKLTATENKLANTEKAVSNLRLFVQGLQQALTAKV